MTERCYTMNVIRLSCLHSEETPRFYIHCKWHFSAVLEQYIVTYTDTSLDNISRELNSKRLLLQQKEVHVMCHGWHLIFFLLAAQNRTVQLFILCHVTVILFDGFLKVTTCKESRWVIMWGTVPRCRLITCM